MLEHKDPKHFVNRHPEWPYRIYVGIFIAVIIAILALVVGFIYGIDNLLDWIIAMVKR